MQEMIREFWNQKKFAVVGVSQRPEKFGNTLFREMRKRGLNVVAVNRRKPSIDGIQVFENLKSIPERPDAVLMVVPPAETDQELRQCADMGITHVWIQQGAESAMSESLAHELGLKAVLRECAIMHMEPVRFPHSLHRWFHTRFGKRH